jgi:hypothetical protein
MTEAQREQMERVAAIVSEMARGVSRADSPEAMRAALNRLTNAGVRLGYAVHLMTGPTPDVWTAASFISAVEADGGANGHIVGGKP